MKAVKLVLGALASAYTVVALLRLLERLTADAGGGRAQVTLVASVVPVAAGAAIALALFQSALRKPPADDAPAE